MKASELVKMVEKAGWVFDRQKGSHKIFEKAGEPRPIVIPDHGGRDLKKGTVAAIIKQAGLR